MFKAVRATQATTGRKPLCINTKEGVTVDPEQQLSIFTDFSRGVFASKDTTKLPETKPAKMEDFIKEEIEKAVRSLKGNKIAGADELKAEQLKYGPTIIPEKIANILNTEHKDRSTPGKDKIRATSSTTEAGEAERPTK